MRRSRADLVCSATGKHLDLKNQATRLKQLAGSAGKDPRIRKSVLDGD